MGRSYGGLGDYEAAESLYVSALEIADSEQVELRAGLLLALGTNWRNSGALDRAVDALEDAVGLTEPLVDTTDAETMAATPELSNTLIGSLQEIGVVLGMSGDYDEALGTLRRAFGLRERISGPDSEEIRYIIDGSGGNVITVDATVGPATTIVGFTIQNGDDGISIQNGAANNTNRC